MSKEVFVFEVSQKSFNQSVILNSYKVPVIVEFMGVWSEPCIVMSDIFSNLAKEFAEEFIFAKIDIDEQTELSEQYNIKNVPTIIVFKDGNPVREETGLLTETEARKLLLDFEVFHESDLLREQARNKHLAGDTPAAILLFTEAMKKDPGNVLIALDMVQIFIDIQQVDQARSLYEKLPESAKSSEMGKNLNGQLLFAKLAEKSADINTLINNISENSEDFDSRFDLAIRHITQYQYKEAMDQLFYILEKDAEYKSGAAREMIITITNMLTSSDSELATSYRRKLANTLAG